MQNEEDLKLVDDFWMTGEVVSSALSVLSLGRDHQGFTALTLGIGLTGPSEWM